MRTRAVVLACAVALILAPACSDDTGQPKPDGGVDMLRTDTVTRPDGPGPDGPRPDTTKPDATSDAPTPDTSTPDASTPDTSTPDTSTLDVSFPDVGTPDTGVAAGLCATAPTVTLVAGSVTINDDINNYTDEFATLKCRSGASGGTGTTQMDGPQAYYRVNGVKDQWYRFTLTTTSTIVSAYVYVFTSTACTEAAIQTDCQSEGVTGDSLRTYADGNDPRALYFKAPANGPFTVAVDATSKPTDGKFTLVIDEVATPTNTTCANAAPLTFFNGKAVVRGDTHELMTPDEFPNVKCPSTAMDGPQVYYSFAAAAGKSYKIKVTNNAGYYLYFYVFGNTCTEAAITADCSSKGATGLFWSSSFDAPQFRETVFTPSTAGTYHVAIDGSLDYYNGNFTLEVEEFTLPANGVCASAQAITLTAGKATISGSTLGQPDEYGAAVDCTGTTDYDGPQVYYKLTTAAGKAYKISLTPSFSSAYWYIFRAASCGNAVNINADCGSGGLDGENPSSVSAGTTETIAFRPMQPGDYLIAIDSSSPTSMGDFQLDVEEITPPANDKACAPTPITLTAGQATITGSTFGAPNEFGTSSTDGINCDLSTVYAGPQVYYELDIDATKGYTFKFMPGFSSAYLYVFQKSSCAARAPVDADCGSGGASGARVGSISSGGTGTLNFSPTTSGKYVIAIDTSVALGGGDFALEISEFPKPQNQTCATAAPLTLTNGEVTVNTTTAFATDEYATLTCKSGTSTSSVLDGPQLYWSLDMDATKNYAVSATTTFSSGYLYIFDGSQTCSAANIQTDCQSGGATGNALGTISSTTKTAYFKPVTSGPYKIAIDSYAAAGDVTLKVTEFGPAANQTCAAAKTLTLVNNTVTESGFTIGTSDEFAGAIKCGGTNAFAGGQTYYKVSMQANVDYFISLSADFQAQLYLFSAGSACTAAAIEADCASAGVSGNFAAVSSASGGAAALQLRPAVAGDFYIVVDSLDALTSGGYALTVTQVVPPTGPRLVINEVNVGSKDFVVLRNAGTVDVSLAGVEFLMADSYASIASPDNAYTFTTQTLKAGESIYLVETTATTGTDIYVGGMYGGAATSFMVMLCQGPCTSTSGANVIDAAQFGTTAVSLPTGIAFAGGPVGGMTVSMETPFSYTRVGFAGKNPTFAKSDWTIFAATR